MKKDERRIKEKLDKLADIAPPEDDILMPESLKTQLYSIINEIPKDEQAPKKSDASSKKRKAIFFSAVGAAAATCAALCCSLLIPKKPANGGQPKFYYDSDLTTNIVDYDKLIADYDILYPVLNYTGTSYTIGIYKDSSHPIYTRMNLTTIDGTIDIITVFVDNYTIANSSRFSDLPLSGTTDLAEYEYRVIEEAARAFAKLEYNGYRYYFDYTSEYPEGIVQIISSLELK